MLAKPPAIVYDHESPRILLADVASGTLRPVAHADWLVLASDQELGFATQSHFTTVFRTLVGMTPRAYQKQRGGEYKSGKILQIPHESGRPHQGVWNRIRLRSGRLLICEKPDTYCPQVEVHDCAGGGRAACGVIEAVDK